MAKLTNYENIDSISKFNKAINNVFSGISARNEQVQQLLLVAVKMAAKSDNFTWLSNLINIAEETKGVNASRILEYVRVVLCNNQIKWIIEKSCINKKRKGDNINYCLNPDICWYDFKKKQDSVRNINYKSQLTNACKRAIDEEKGGLNASDIVEAVLAAGVKFDELMESVNKLDWRTSE